MAEYLLHIQKLIFGSQAPEVILEFLLLISIVAALIGCVTIKRKKKKYGESLRSLNEKPAVVKKSSSSAQQVSVGRANAANQPQTNTTAIAPQSKHKSPEKKKQPKKKDERTTTEEKQENTIQLVTSGKELEDLEDYTQLQTGEQQGGDKADKALQKLKKKFGKPKDKSEQAETDKETTDFDLLKDLEEPGRKPKSTMTATETDKTQISQRIASEKSKKPASAKISIDRTQTELERTQTALERTQTMQ